MSIATNSSTSTRPTTTRPSRLRERVARLRSLRPAEPDDTGAATAEYAITILATVLRLERI